ncbi:tetratricopeptide repeat protein [Roseimicrobium gellanilyticum]|uniref:Tetratricopeptide repeat protein n=1 Tax=Roseimicrobium gellanilyticum TaxID=748857 RepID=A0A366HKV8_9BACT|nr:tetratricopeptide repeat protein [Roseimicrobium gellanilyticum]RBP42659.1 tetratricopeptide repeat protein [Roseimicrobium gellanilyticum]
MIRVHDGYGREMLIPKSEWCDKVLLPNIRQAWNKPDELYDLLLAALNDELGSKVVDAAKHLFEIDPIHSRGTCIWGVVLMEEGRLQEAETVFRRYLEKHGEEPVILTNLARLHSKRGEGKRAEELLWHSLELDPNLDSSFGWYLAIFRKRDGEEAVQDATRRMSKLPGSWRAQLWLARTALASRALDEALAHYSDALSHATNPVPTDLLMQMSGDLGNHGHLPELLHVTVPHFKAEIHGLTVGNNLIKACLDLGQLEQAKQLLDLLYSQKRHDWQQHLSYWDTEIAKARLATVPQTPVPEFKFAMLSIEGPVWLKQDSPASELFPERPDADGMVIAFMGSSAEQATNSKRIEAQMPDMPGRLSRALPLFLSEYIGFGTLSGTRTLVPWIVEPTGAFVVSGACWSDGDAANSARRDEPLADYVVITHLQAQSEPYVVELRLVRTIDAKCLGQLSCNLMPATPQDSLPHLANRLMALLEEVAEVTRRNVSATAYQLPEGDFFANYLLRLEQMLAVRCAAMETTQAHFLSGEHEIIDGNIQLSVACPENIPIRILLAQTLLTMKKVHRNILPDFREKMELLQKQHPLPPPAQGVAQRMLDDALAT